MNNYTITVQWDTDAQLPPHITFTNLDTGRVTNYITTIKASEQALRAARDARDMERARWEATT